MTSKKKKYREISRQQAEDLYKLGIEFQYRTKAGKGHLWRNHAKNGFYITASSRGVDLEELYGLRDTGKAFHFYVDNWRFQITLLTRVLVDNSTNHHDEIADVLKIKFYYRTEVE